MSSTSSSWITFDRQEVKGGDVTLGTTDPAHAFMSLPDSLRTPRRLGKAGNIHGLVFRRTLWSRSGILLARLPRRSVRNGAAPSRSPTATMTVGTQLARGARIAVRGRWAFMTCAFSTAG